MKAGLQSSPCNVPGTAGSAGAEPYAAGFSTRGELRDGTSVCVRAIRPDDKERLRIAFDRLSPRSVYQRFFHPVNELTPEVLRQLTEIDFRDHVGLVMTVGNDTDERLIAVGRLVRVVSDRSCAEVAITVEDEQQHRGAATLLLQQLISVARSLGLRALIAHVLDDNREMLSVLENSRLPLLQTLKDGVRRVVLSLEAAT
jgi:GNAT superfamily N-acetyltransferase